jgi:hypothetical protein
MIRSNHYEVAFEAYLRARRVGYVAVDETRRTQFGEEKYKSLDFIVVGPDDARLVVDVKGRKFPGGTREKPVFAWQNWAEAEDVRGLTHWAAHLGEGFRGVLAFVYLIQEGFALPEGTPDLFEHQQQSYLMRAIEVSQYREHMRQRSPRWQTVHLPAAIFREIVKPFSEFLFAGKIESDSLP